jgi:uncharacterized protein with HEPN domain
MYDNDLVKDILIQIDQALGKISSRISNIKNAAYFTDSPEGMEKLDGICMLFIAVGESLKNIDKITSGALFSRYPEIDWTGVKGFRDIIVHHYFDVDAEQVFWICTHELHPLSQAVKKILGDLE